KGQNLSFLELSFFQPTTVDKEPKKRIIAGVKTLNIMRFLMKKFSFHTHLKSKREFIILRTCILQISIGRI
ncbi:hypothetical protein, partial [Streptococcus pneumoniae]|uniref:hypothetical protein n=1 Tax=Streptococcus pneumoniae TaxID=1313 RepID=UPI0019D4021F